MKRPTIIITEDGSTSLSDPNRGDLYHSKHGAETESRYVFIASGLAFLSEKKNKINLLEVGFGTGLNAILTAEYLLHNPRLSIDYTGLEPFPLASELLNKMDFPCFRDPLLRQCYDDLTRTNLGQKISLSPRLQLELKELPLLDYRCSDSFDLIYYDAFGPAYQPEMWNEQAVTHLKNLVKKDGIIVTYCAQGAFRRLLIDANFEVERLPGPPGKRQMIRATHLG
ncbi:MAG: tRNA (5-methylaminomethyl-2-thiouridine)(34)-methyltransferase MnmD [Vicingaceae bacterium]